MTKNDHFRQMLQTAQARGFVPTCVFFDSWYAGLVNPDGHGLRPLAETDVSATGTVVHLKGYGWVKIFKLVAPDGDINQGGLG